MENGWQTELVAEWIREEEHGWPAALKQAAYETASDTKLAAAIRRSCKEQIWWSDLSRGSLERKIVKAALLHTDWLYIAKRVRAES